VNKLKPITLEAEIQIIEETEELMKEAAAIVDFPKNKTPDMLFFSGCFVSSGQNLNDAFFLPSEMVKARHTIDNKALDIEHEEENIIGHIYSSVFVDQNGKKLNAEDLAELSDDVLNKMDIDIMIAGIIYKSRFPKLADEVAGGKWKLSMETYYQGYDVKIGDVILSQKEAEALGIANSEVLGKFARIIKRGKELAAGAIARVLKDLMFSGCGLVKQPANPRSLIFETAKKKENEDEIIIELDSEEIAMEKNLETKETVVEETGVDEVSTEEAEEVDSENTEETEDADIDSYDVRKQTSVGICVSYKKYVYANEYVGPDTEILHENWCTLYESACTSFGRDVTDPNCLRRQAEEQAASYVASKLQESIAKDKRGELLSDLKGLLK